jgi:DNA-binding MarR family transcriptional regulator
MMDFRKKLRILEREIGIELKNETSCCNVTLAQCHILLELNESESLSISEIADILGLDSSTLSRTIDGLVEKGFVIRTTDINDRRAVQLKLSENGIKKVESINEQCNNTYREFLQFIPEDKIASVLEVMELIAEGLKNLRKGSPAERCCP